MHLYIDDAIPDQRLEKYTHLDRRRLVREGGGREGEGQGRGRGRD